MDLNTVFLGARLWIWLYFAFGIVLVGVAFIRFFIEQIKRKWYEIRHPEKLLKIVMHYKNNYYKEYFRIIPDNYRHTIEGKEYIYTDKAVKQNPDIFVQKDKKGNEKIIIEGKTYNINNSFAVKNRWKAYAEVHYYFNNPVPINYDLSKKTLEFSSKQLQDYKENELFGKLLSLQEEKRMLSMLMIFSIINILISAFVLCKIMGWIE